VWYGEVEGVTGFCNQRITLVGGGSFSALLELPQYVPSQGSYFNRGSLPPVAGGSMQPPQQYQQPQQQYQQDGGVQGAYPSPRSPGPQGLMSPPPPQQQQQQQSDLWGPHQQRLFQQQPAGVQRLHQQRQGQQATSPAAAAQEGGTG
jgi:hypothetical protein